MTAEQIKTNIKEALQSFAKGNITEKSLELFEELGYITSRRAPLYKPTYTEFKDTYIGDRKFDETKAKASEWKYVDLLFQLSKEEVLKQMSLFDTKQVNRTIIETYLFFVIELERTPSTSGRAGEGLYSRTELSIITREVNRLFPMPAMILFKHGKTLTLSVINRRLHKKDESKDVLEKVTLIKDISIAEPHRAHLEILYDLSFEKLKEEFEFTNFVELHNGWRDTLNIKALNDKFYKDIANWFFWACKHVEFPDDDEYYQNRETRNSENVIRLLTRIIFCWFMKEKGLIKAELFKESEIEKLLIKDADKTGSTYYKAILQNLFFATLNIPVKKRKFISDKIFQGKNKNHFDHSVFRYKRFFKPNAGYLKFFKDIPFLNGGLFECLDYKLTNDKDVEVTIRIDCFSNNEKNEKRLKVPDEILFGKGSRENWLNDIFGTRNQEYVVKGIFKILNEYKFTIQENTPLEEEIALDPDLLGIVFENLLASYNPETKDTARKQTGSFYTPREIVSYMVDESLVAYFKNKITDADEEKIREMLSETEKETELSTSQKVKLINAIDEIKIIDPACGSGAFPMGILQKLVHLLHKLDGKNIHWKKSILARTPVEIRKQTEVLLKTKSADYIRKLGLIQNCIYGVDVQPVAVEISKLRFFLSLLVDFDKTDSADDNWGIEPLPNLDFKIMQGNSLVEEFNGVSLKMKPNESSGALNFVDEKLQGKITDLHEKQGLFLRETNPNKKKDLKNEVNEKLIEIFHYQLTTIKATYFNELKKIEDNRNRIRNKSEAEKYFEAEKAKADKKFGFNYLKFEKDLKQLISGKKPRNFFPYSLFFAEVFEKDGFDIVIGNPPYISYYSNTGSSLTDEEKKFFVSNFEGVIKVNDRINSMNLMTEQGIRVLKKNGHLSFITNKTIAVLPSYIEVRRFILSKSRIEYVVTDLDPFEAIVDCVIIGLNKSIDSDYDLKWFKGGVDSYEIKNVSQFTSNPKLEFHFSSHQNILSRIEEAKNKLEDLIIINRGVNIGGCFDDFLSSTKRSNSYWKYLGGTRNINRFSFKWFEADGYMKFDSALEDELRTQGKTLALGNHARYKTERLFIPESGQYLMAAYCNKDYYSAYGIMVGTNANSNYSIKYSCALLNSKLFTFYSIEKEILRKGKKATPHVGVKGLNSIPVHMCRKDVQQIFCCVTDYILECKTERNNGTPVNSLVDSFFESLNNLLVYELYFEKEIVEAGLSVIGHLKNMKEISNLNSSSKKMEVILSEHEKLNAKDHPVRKAIFNMDTIELIKIIEGKNL
jgi:adenine-specific DNA-methyltransferase